MNKSCVGCKYLYSYRIGYNNYTWIENVVDCAKDKNKNLPSSEPCNWVKEDDNWSKTNTSRCHMYKEGVFIQLDVDGEDKPSDYTNDKEQIITISKHKRLI